MLEHDHPLNLTDLWLEDEEETDEDEHENEKLVTKEDFRCPCDRCGDEINWFHRYYYKCDQCHYSIHKFCKELPETFQHTFDVAHTCIISKSRYKWSCRICKTKHMPDVLSYSCQANDCYYIIDIRCVTRFLNTNIIHHPSHIHPLVRVAKEILCKCDACGKEQKGIFYQCANNCPLFLHNDCAFLPTKLLIQQTTNDIFSDPHPLTLAYSFAYKDIIDRFLPKCRVCNRDLGHLWIYKCDKCRFYAHLDCATSRLEPFMSIFSSPGMGKLPKNFKDDDYPDLVHLPFPDQAYNIVKHLFSNETGSTTLDTNDVNQTQIIHKHRVILVDTTKPTSSSIKMLSCHNPMKRVELLCNGCVRPIMNSSFYTCANEDEHCDFVLHEWCIRLPLEVKDHPGHPQHTLVYMPKARNKYYFGVFRCVICSLSCNGFVYCCLECDYLVDVCCAFIPEKITHKAHQNHLLLRVQEQLVNRFCRLCSDDIFKGEFIFSCQDCNFHLHPACALFMSDTITHKYDKHSMNLSYLPIENHMGEYFCEICEEQFDPAHASFYHCRKCDHSMHPACAASIQKGWSYPPPYSDIRFFQRMRVNAFLNIKFGARHNIKTHSHPLSFVRGMGSDGECTMCHRTFWHDMIFKCLQCKFSIHYTCCILTDNLFINLF